MSNMQQRYSYHQLVSFNKFDTSIERVVERMWALMGGKPTKSLFPTLIGVDVNYTGQPDILRLMRGFLNQLHKVHTTHFVRFVTDTVWAMESDRGYLFYTCDGDKTERCDAIWTITSIGTDQVEIGIKIPENNQRRALLDELSVSLGRFVMGPKGDASTQLLNELMGSFYKKAKGAHQINHLKESLHILFMPTRNHNGYYPVPLYGMSYFDGKRRYRQVTQQLDHQRFNHYELFKEETTPGKILHTLLTSVQENDKFGVRKELAQETYGLTELVFGMWATNHNSHESNHDMILFNVIDNESKRVQVARVVMNEIAVA